MKHGKERLAQELRIRLALIVRERVADPRLEGLTIVEVRPARDASFARVFYQTLGAPDDAAAALAKAKPYIRRCLAEGLKLRRVPELDFRLDPTLERAERVEGILRELGPAKASAATDKKDPA